MWRSIFEKACISKQLFPYYFRLGSAIISRRTKTQRFWKALAKADKNNRVIVRFSNIH